MEKIFSYNPESCSYEEIRKPFMMHNMMLISLMFTSFIFFLLTCYYHAQNEKTMELAPGIAKNCFSEVETLKMELVKQKQHLQLLSNQRFLMKDAILPQASMENNSISFSNLVYNQER